MSRVKKAVVRIGSREELEAVVAKITMGTILSDKLTVDMDKSIANIRSTYAPRLDQISADNKVLLGMVEDWAQDNQAEFGKAKSLDLTQGRIGWRSGNPALRTAKGFDWSGVLTMVRALFPRFIRIKEEVNKEAILQERESLQPSDLHAMGVRVVQSETFFCDPKREPLTVEA